MFYIRIGLFFLIPIATSIGSPAQTKLVTSPPGWQQFEGDVSSTTFGQYADARYQFADGEYRGRGMKLTQVGYRHDWRWYAHLSGSGRTWKSVSLHVSECDFFHLSPTWTANATSATTMVFSSSVTWPTVTGRPNSGTSGPARLNTALSFPFRTPWIYPGTKDLLLDFVFQGGTLANNWSRWSGNVTRAYRLDSLRVTTALGPTKESTLPSNCTDSSQQLVAFVDLSFTTYGPNTGTPKSNTMESHTYSHHTAVSAPVFHVISLGRSQFPMRIPGWCGNLWIDLRTPSMTAIGLTDSLGRATLNKVSFPFVSALVGKDLHAQVAWSDSKTKQMKIGRGERIVVPPQPAPLPRRRAQYSYWHKNPTGFGFEFTYWHNPIAFYSFQ